jgi:hypothetical protein
MRRRTVGEMLAQRWRYVVVCMVYALALLLVGCGGATSTGTNTGATGVGSQPTKVVGHAQESGVSTVTFTASGGSVARPS